MRVPLEDPAAVLDRLRGGADAQAGAPGILRESDWSAWPALISTRLIPHLSRMTSETEGGSDRKRQETQSAGHRAFPPPALVTDSARTTLSQGGDTGSIPFGTAQVRGT